MQSLTCPIPSNINPLQSNGFMFAINKLPNVSYFCQEANLPGLNLPAADMSTPFVDVPVPGEKLTFDEMTITFLIDENMANYIAIHNWMIGLGFPKSHAQYQQFIRNNASGLNTNELITGYSDGVLQIMNSSNNPIRTVQFSDLFPTQLQSIQLQSTTQDTVYLAGTATFRYTLYEFV